MSTTNFKKINETFINVSDNIKNNKNLIIELIKLNPLYFLYIKDNFVNDPYIIVKLLEKTIDEYPDLYNYNFYITRKRRIHLDIFTSDDMILDFLPNNIYDEIIKMKTINKYRKYLLFQKILSHEIKFIDYLKIYSLPETNDILKFIYFK